MDFALAQVGEQFVDALRLRDEVRRAGDLGQCRAAIFRDAAQQIFCVDDARDVVDRLVVERDAAEALLDDELQRVVDRLRLVEADDVDARRHDLARDGVLHLDDAADHLALFLFDGLAVRLDLGEAKNLVGLVLFFFGVDLDDGRESLVDRAGDRAEDRPEEADERRQTHAPTLGVTRDDQARQRVQHGDDDQRQRRGRAEHAPRVAAFVRHDEHAERRRANHREVTHDGESA